MSSLYLSAGIELNAGKDLDAAVKALNLLVENTRAEPGCIRFEIIQQRDKPEQFTLWEIWVDDAALAAHFEYPHTKACLAHGFTKVNYVEKLNAMGNTPE